MRTLDEVRVQLAQILDDLNKLAACACTHEQSPSDMIVLNIVEWATVENLAIACRWCVDALQDHLQYDDGESLEREAHAEACVALRRFDELLHTCKTRT